MGARPRFASPRSTKQAILVRSRRCGRVPGALFLGLAVLAWDAPTVSADDLDNCLLCHQYRGLSRYDNQTGLLNLLFVRSDYVHDRLGPHARVSCTGCHPRDEVSTIPHKPVSPVNCTQTCHLTDPGGLERRYTHAPLQDMLARGVHTPEMLSKLNFSGGPLLRNGQSQCLYCHDEPIFRDPQRIPLIAGLGRRTFDRCDVCHQEQIPVDTAYYLRHITSRLQPARPSLEMAQVCAVCHSDPQVLADHPMTDAVASYVRSFHGKAALLGDEATANCVSCHVARGANAHLMLGRADKRSSVNPRHVADSCRSPACHPGAGKQLGGAAVHLDLAAFRGTIEYFLAAAFILFTVITFGPSMVIVILELFALVIGRQHHGAEQLEHLAAKVWAHPEGRRRLIRFTTSQRIQHWVLVLLFTLLALTGFPMKFASQPWAHTMIGLFGGLGPARIIHHYAGIALFAGLMSHLVYVAWSLRQMRRAARQAGQPLGLIAAVRNLPMWVNPSDVRQMNHLLLYLLHIRHDRPIFDRFNVKEKFEYFGVFWGTVLLGITGAMLWGTALTTQYFSGRVLNLALIAHTYEAFLAVIHVGILHIINVMLHPLVFPLSPATITGRTPLPILAEEHTGQVLRVAQELGLSQEEVAHG